MSIEYTVHASGQWMTHTAKKLNYETVCDGCGMLLNRIVCVVTDRSGSEYSVVHNDSPECLEATIDELELEREAQS